MGGEDGFGVELEAVDGAGFVGDCHDVVAAGCDGFEGGRQLVGDEGVVAGDFDLGRQLVEEGVGVVGDEGFFAVDDFGGGGDAAAEGLHYRLVAETDAEEGLVFGEFLDEFDETASVGGSAGAGGEDDEGGVFLAGDFEDAVGGGGVADDVDLGAELSEGVDEVEGEGIVVVD